MGGDMEPRLGLEIKIASNVIKRRIDRSSIVKHIESLTGTQSWIICFLYENQNRDVFQRDLESEFSLRRSTITGILQLMEKNQLIKRESVSYDARLKKLVLTDKAIELHHQLDSELLKMEEELMRGITSEEKEIFIRVMDKIKSNLSE